MKLASTFAASMAAAVALAAASTPAQAVTGLYGGGGTLAEKVYRDLFNRYGSTSSGDLCAGLATVCPTTHYNSAVEILYVGVGSGNGLKALDGYDPTLYVAGGRSRTRFRRRLAAISAPFTVPVQALRGSQALASAPTIQR